MIYSSLSVAVAVLALAAAPALAASPPAVDLEQAQLSPLDISTSQLLEAQINPNGLDTTYHFEYGTTTSYGTSAPVPDADESSGTANYGGTGDFRVIQRISGLQPNTTYHFRVVATNAAGTTPGADQTFATGKGFGVASFTSQATNQDGSLDTQAGSHPYALTTSIELNLIPGTRTCPSCSRPEGNVRDIVTNIPAGLIGDPAAIPECTQQQLAGHLTIAEGVNMPDCPAASQVGVLTVRGGQATGDYALYNMVPPRGEAAQFGINAREVNAFIDFKLRTGGDYGVTATSSNTSVLEPLTGFTLTLWGVPADPSHDPQRRCPGEGVPTSLYNPSCPGVSGAPLTPLLTLPTSCTGPLTTTLSVDSYQNPGQFLDYSYQSQDAPGDPVADMTGCSKLDFSPSITVQPDTSVADSPAGLSVDLHLPQNNDPLPAIFGGGNYAPATGVDYSPLATASLKDSEVVLPAGMTVNAAAANGLEGCSEAQIELKGPNPAKCPEASKVGTVEVDTPLEDHPLKGSIYVAQQGNAGAAQGSNEFGSLLALYLTVDDPQTGVVVKLAGKVSANPLTGQLTTTFDEDPQLPFEDLKVNIFGGQRASLATPLACGTYTTTASEVPWSGTAPVQLSSPLQITSGPGGSACAAAGFGPSFSAGSTNIQAGGFSPFTFTLSRNDGEQRLSTVATTLPKGLAGVLASVPLCGEPQASAGTCPEASKIGHVTVSDGVGPDPLRLPQSGKPQDPVYLTGPYDGAPFGLAIVVPAEAGPFNLGTVVTRARVEVDPNTAQVSVTSNPLPTILQGIPVEVRAINVTVDRSGFTFNPTSCEPTSVNGVVTSTQGATAKLASHFQVTNCGALNFKPGFQVTTSGKTSKANGASLSVKLTYPNAPQGTQANIARVKVDLPKQLPSRLTTLQKACTTAQFNANPAGCPASSFIGQAKAITPVLPVPLEGPAIFVSHGGEAFPSLILVLQGYGVRIDLVGTTFISKAGITSSTFKTVPDQPVTSFELTLPEGPYSALTANNSNLCALTRTVLVKKRVTVRTRGRKRTVTRRVKQILPASLSMPTEFVAQNGATLHQNTPVSVTGCAKTVRHERKKSHRKKK